jgi:hypothetical protein
VEAYDFSGVRRLVDVGGGYGLLLWAILAANPGLTGVLFDRPGVVDVVARIERADTRSPAGLSVLEASQPATAATADDERYGAFAT